MTFCLCVILLFAATRAESTNASCKDMLQGYLTGPLTSALGAYQVEALKREFKSFIDVIEKSMNVFKQKIKADVERSQGNKLGFKLKIICYDKLEESSK